MDTSFQEQSELESLSPALEDLLTRLLWLPFLSPHMEAEGEPKDTCANALHTQLLDIFDNRKETLSMNKDKNLATVNKQTKLTTPAFDNLVNDFFGFPLVPFKMPDLAVFKLDVKENDKGYKVEAEMPGVKREDISLDLNDGYLTISVASKQTSEEKDDDEKIIHQERRDTYMERSVYLPEAADEGVDARLENGELIIAVPKAKVEPTAKKIAIK